MPLVIGIRCGVKLMVTSLPAASVKPCRKHALTLLYHALKMSHQLHKVHAATFNFRAGVKLDAYQGTASKQGASVSNAH